MSRWVQHKKDPNGRKWEVISTYGDGFNVSDRATGSSHRLPRDEYVIVDPPEQWEDVTAEFSATKNWPSEAYSKSNGICGEEDRNMYWVPCEQHHTGDLRLRKIDGLHNGPAFIVERKRS